MTEPTEQPATVPYVAPPPGRRPHPAPVLPPPHVPVPRRLLEDRMRLGSGGIETGVLVHRLLPQYPKGVPVWALLEAMGGQDFERRVLWDLAGLEGCLHLRMEFDDWGYPVYLPVMEPSHVTTAYPVPEVSRWPVVGEDSPPAHYAPPRRSRTTAPVVGEVWLTRLDPEGNPLSGPGDVIAVPGVVSITFEEEGGDAVL